MTIEDRLRASLHARAADVVPAETEWDRVASKATARTQRRRRIALGGALATAVTAAATIAALVGIDVSGHRPSTRVVSGGAAAPSTTASAPSTSAALATVPPTLPPDQPVPASFGPRSVTWISITEGWALGTAASGPVIARTHDGGRTWSAPPTTAFAAASIRFADAHNGWQFGPDLFVTHDGGMSWRQITSFGGPVTSVEAAAGSVYAVAGATLLTSPVGTDSWRILGAGVVAPGATITLHGSTGYSTGADGAVVAFSTAGPIRRTAPCRGAPPSSLAAVSATQIAAVCVTDPAAGSSTKMLMVSTDGARTWSAVGIAPRGGQPDALAAASTNVYVVGAASGDSVLYRTADGGRTWTTVYRDTTTGGAPWADLGFTDATHGVAVLGGSRLLTTSDAGVTWTAVHFAA